MSYLKFERDTRLRFTRHVAMTNTTRYVAHHGTFSFSWDAPKVSKSLKTSWKKRKVLKLFLLAQ